MILPILNLIDEFSFAETIKTMIIKLLSKNIIILFLITASIIAYDKEQPATQTANNNGGTNNMDSAIYQNFYITGKADGVPFISIDDIRFAFAKSQFVTHQWVGVGDSLGSVNLQITDINGTSFKGVGRYDHTTSDRLSLTWIVNNPRDSYNSDGRKFGLGLANGFVNVTIYDSAIVEETFEFEG